MWKQSTPLIYSIETEQATMSSLYHNQSLQALLDSARPFLRGDLESVDKNLPSLLSVLRSAGAGECWHKSATFLDHFVGIYRTLKLWKADDAVCLCGLFHSSYNNNSNAKDSFFHPSAGRAVVRSHVGAAAERLIQLFCTVPRLSIIHEGLLSRYADQELILHLEVSEVSLKKAKENGLFDPDEDWRKKVESVLPAAGIAVKHIRTGEDVNVSRRVWAIFLLMTMADFSEQFFSFQDALYENFNGRLELSGENYAGALWPGDCKPGLWLNSLSRMGALYSLIAREEEILIEQRRVAGAGKVAGDRDEDIELTIPQVFNNCTRILNAEDQKAARELYWEGVCEKSKKDLDGAEEVFLRCIEKNPFVGEPHVVLAQVYLAKSRFEEAEIEAERGLRLLLEWGSPWDKRMSWECWVAWCRVLVRKAKEKSWPDSSRGIIRLGFV